MPEYPTPNFRILKVNNLRDFRERQKSGQKGFGSHCDSEANVSWVYLILNLANIWMSILIFCG